MVIGFIQYPLSLLVFNQYLFSYQKEDPMKMKKQIQNEKGMALVVILAVVVLMSLIGTTILFSSNTGRKISTSYKGSADALQNADAGIAEAAQILFNEFGKDKALRDPKIVGPQVACDASSNDALNWKNDGYTKNIANEYTVSYIFRKDNAGVKKLACDEAGNPLYQIISKGYVTPAGGSAFVAGGPEDGKLNKNFSATSSGAAGVEKKLEAMVQVINSPGTGTPAIPGTPGTSPVITLDPAFGAGIVTNGDLRINGSSNIDGGTHTNGDTRFNGSGTVTGNVNAVGSITTNGSWTTGSKNDNAPTIVVPQVTDGKLADLKAAAQSSGVYNSGNFNYNGSGDLGNKVIFAEGNLTLNGSIINGTIVAKGNVTINGSSQINGDGVIGTAIVAKGNITMNGSSDSNGAFWSNGSFVQNGASRVIGSIVSRGDITRNGSFNFTANGNIQNDNLPKVTTPGTPGTPGTPANPGAAGAPLKYKVLSLKEV
jgi:cytoskeletal protein CcmA (bactofilin family)